MPDEAKSNAKNETATDFIRKQVDRSKNNLQCAINRLGHDALKIANPVPWFKRYPVTCSIVSGALVGGGALLVGRVIKHRQAPKPRQPAPPVNVYIKKPKAKSKGWSQLGAALITVLTSKVSENVRATITDSFASAGQDERAKSKIIPNPNLRGVEI